MQAGQTLSVQDFTTMKPCTEDLDIPFWCPTSA